MTPEFIANAAVIGGWALGLALLAGAFVVWFFGLDVRAKRLARRLRARVGKPGFVRSASWWVDRAGRAARPARHRARGLAGAAVRRSVRRVVVAAAVLVDELTVSSRLVTA